MSEKPKKFIKGHNVLKPKSAKPLSKSKELEKKKVIMFVVMFVLSSLFVLNWFIFLIISNCFSNLSFTF